MPMLCLAGTFPITSEAASAYQNDGGESMDRVRVMLHRLRAVLLRGRMERELREEIGAHLQMQEEENLRRGMSEGEARREARQFCR